MKTARHFIFLALPFFFSGKLFAQRTLDGRDIPVPDRSSLVEWLSSDAVFTFGLVIGLVCLLLWLIHLGATLMITMQVPERTQQKDRPPHTLPTAGVPHLEIEMPGLNRFGANMLAIGRKSKGTPGSKSGKSDSDDPARGSDPPRRT